MASYFAGLFRAKADEYRLVRVRAAPSLARYPDLKLTEQKKITLMPSTKSIVQHWPHGLINGLRASTLAITI